MNLAALLDAVHTLLVRFVAFANPHQPIAVTLWVAHTWVLDRAETTPYLGIWSAAKQSGKSLLLELLELLVRSSYLVTMPSEAVLVRELDENQCTLLLDETDAIFSRSREFEGLRAIINAGHRRGAQVPRCEVRGKQVVRVKFNVFGARRSLASVRTSPTPSKTEAFRLG